MERQAMTHAVQEAEPVEAAPSQAPQERIPDDDSEKQPFFILYLSGPEYVEELRRLSFWVERLLIPVYGQEASSAAPWCPRWREHQEAVAHLHALWLAWQERTGPNADATGPAQWHRDFLGPTMETLRSPSGPFAGCKPGIHREKERPFIEDDGFLNF
jgi:hypothetical protein